MGCTAEVREFLRWYARYQAPDGKVPCCVDRRGADRVSEHDSPGAFVYAVAEYYRYTHDVGFLHDLWPSVPGAVDDLPAVLEQSMGAGLKAPDKAAFHAILPASISHEGYAAYPVHSYWDDFFALRGLKDAADMARVVGDETRTAKLAALRDAFREALYASIRRTIAQHGIDFLPGSAELGDFDPTSTSVALAPAGEIGNLPEPALTRTFDRYWGEFEARRHGDTDWEEYSPYELRNVGAFVRLGEKQRALELLDALLAHQRHRPGVPREHRAGVLTTSPLDRLDDPAPHARLLSNGRYTVLVTGAGSGFSRWDGLALTAWSADRTEDAEGFFLYVRDLERGIFWSLGHQPVQRPAARYGVRYRPGVVTITRLDDGIEAALDIAVVPDGDLEVRRVRLRNRSRRPRRLGVTTYAEVVLHHPAAHAAHPAF